MTDHERAVMSLLSTPTGDRKYYACVVPSVDGSIEVVLCRWAASRDAWMVGRDGRLVWALTLLDVERLAVERDGISWLRRLIQAGHFFAWSGSAIACAGGDELAALGLADG